MDKYVCHSNCVHYRPQYNHCVFWLDYVCGFCDKTSLRDNLARFCRYKQEDTKNDKR